MKKPVKHHDISAANLRWIVRDMRGRANKAAPWVRVTLREVAKSLEAGAKRAAGLR